MRKVFPGYTGRFWISNIPEHSPAGLKKVEIDIEKTGFVVYMLPREFLELNPTRTKKKNLESLSNHLDCGGAIGPPRLSVIWISRIKGWQVINHEGRGRTIALNKKDPISEIPVCIVPRDGTEPRYLKNNQLFSPIYADCRSPSGKIGYRVAFYPTRLHHLGVEKNLL